MNINKKRRINVKALFRVLTGIIALTIAIGTYITVYGGQVVNEVKINNLQPTVINTVADTEEEKVEKTDFSTLLSQNSDTVGWLNIAGADIDYPVLKGTDNEFYLKHGFDKTKVRGGSVFMDYRNNANLDFLTVLYGHNNLDGKVFSNIEKFENKAFAEQNSTFSFNTLERNYNFVVVGGFYATADAAEDNGYVFNYICTDIADESKAEFIYEIATRCIYTADVDVSEDDNILLLSTCTRNLDTRNHTANARFVLVARAIRAGENVNSVNYTTNSSARMPQIWYDANGISNPYAGNTWYPKTVA